MHTQKKSSQTTGFTIVELLIVIVVIAILTAISVVAYTGIQERARNTAHQQEASQIERQLMIYATLSGNDATDISGKLVGYQEGIGERKLIAPLTGTPDITMYIVCAVVSTAANYQTITQLSPWNTANQSFRIQTGAGGSNMMGYRIDTSSHSNAGGNVSGARIPGNATIGWLQVSNSLNVRTSGWNQAAANNSNSLNPGAGWNFTGISLTNQNSCTPRIALVFSAAHNQSTRAAVVGWLAEKYEIDL